MKKIILCILALALASCAKAPLVPVEEGAATHIWNEMEAASAKAEGPYRLQLSMRFGKEGDTRRVTGILWGNDENATRLDVMAGVGATVARVAEAGDDFLVYMPRQNKAYAHHGENHPLVKVGVPLPFDLARLTELLTGRFAQVFGREPEKAVMLANGDAEYELTGTLAGKLEIAPNGSPVSWVQKSGGWRFDLAYDEDAPHLPKSLKIFNRDGTRAIILIKERESVTSPFAPDQLRLVPPAGAPLLPIEQLRALVPSAAVAALR